MARGFFQLPDIFAEEGFAGWVTQWSIVRVKLIMTTPIGFSMSWTPEGSNARPLTSDPMDEGDRAWSPDGRRIIFNAGDFEHDETVNMYVMNSDGSDIRPVANEIRMNWFPAWSPDGQYIIFGSSHEGNRNIYIANADGTQLRRLTNHTAYDDFPVWQPVPR